jgi:uncharacterized RDD family membrane protein YckC
MSFTDGDPLGGASTPPGPVPASQVPPRPPDGPEAPGYGGGPVPPGAFRPPTPAAAAPGPYTLADYGARAGAAIIDWLIVCAISAAILVPVLAVGVSISSSNSGAAAFVVTMLFSLVIVFIATLLYAPLLLVRWDGQTVGKRVTGIKVIRVDGRKLDFGWALLREVIVKNFLLAIVATVTIWIAWLLNYLWPLWDAEKRAGHDFICNSRVVEA